jgi:HAD superfamily hydrolase (TIGR01509 family)
MDGLLLDTERLGLRLFSQICAELHIDPQTAENMFLSLIGGPKSVNDVKVETFFKGRLDLDGFERRWIDGKAHMLRDSIPLRPYVHEVITGLAEQGAQMVVVTSTVGAVARHELEQADLLRHFQLVIAGDEVTANKPDPAPYLQGAAALGLDPTECAAFEDSDTGITAAVRAGCQAVQIPDLRTPDVPLPVLGQNVAQDLRQAVGLFGIHISAELV